jgi:hypothetical protein
MSDSKKVSPLSINPKHEYDNIKTTPNRIKIHFSLIPEKIGRIKKNGYRIVV